MSEKVIDMNENVANETEEIKGTEFVEPAGKGRKVIKYVLTGVAAVATFLVGFFTGRATDKDDGGTEESSGETESND